jgi:hypothetical protein
MVKEKTAKESCSPPEECFSESMVELELFNFEGLVAKSENAIIDVKAQKLFLNLKAGTMAIYFGQNI